MESKDFGGGPEYPRPERWAFHVCLNLQLLDKEMEYLARVGTPTAEVPIILRCTASCQVRAPSRPLFLGVLAGRDQA
jgi:hypothetical protein